MIRAQKRGRGRPIADEPTHGAHFVRVILTPDELKEIDKARWRDGAERGPWIRAAALAKARTR